MDDSGLNYHRLFEAALSEAPADLAEEPNHGVVNGYALLEKIGEGGMGVVWRAREPETGRLVALKQLRFIDVSQRDSGAPDDARSARFRREIALAARLEHPGIARVYDSGGDETTGAPFFTMELVEGRSFGAEAESELEALITMVRVCEAVEHAHRNGVIHRDLKPANILVTVEGNPKVLDFGVARALEESEIRTDLFGGDPAMTLSEDGEIFGTPHHMAPEQARGQSSRCDTRTDVYALGTILYRQLTGGYPHDPAGKTTWELLHAVAETEPRPPAEAARSSGRRRPAPDLEAILMKAVAFSPDDRYDSAGDLGRDLSHYLAGEPVTAQPLTASYWLKKHVARHRVRWLAGVTALAAVAVVGVLWLKQRERFIEEQVTLREKAESEEKAARDSEVRSLVRLARERTESGARGEGLAHLARAVRLDPDFREARAALMAAMKQFPTLYRASPTVRFKGSSRASAFSADGSWFAIAMEGEEAGLRIWDTETLTEQLTVTGRFSIRDLRMAPTGDYVAVLLDYWDVEEKPPGASCLILATPKGVLHRVEFERKSSTLAFSGDGKYLAVTGEAVDVKGGRFGGAMIFEMSDPKAPVAKQPFRELSRPGFPRVAFSSEGSALYFLKQEADARLHRWDLETGEQVRTVMRAAPEDWRPLFLNQFVIHHGGDFFLSGQGEFVARWRDYGDRQERLWTDQVEGAIAFVDMVLSPDGRHLAAAGTDGRAVVWDAETGRRLAELSHTERVEEVWFCPGKPDLLAAKTGTQSVILWDWRVGKAVAEPLEGGQSIFTVSFSPNGERILVGRADHMRMWSTTPRSWEPEVIDLGTPVNAIAFTGQGMQLLATLHEAERVDLVDGYSGKTLESWPHRTLYDHTRNAHRFTALANREGRYVVTADSPSVLQIRPLSESEILPSRLELSALSTAITATEDGRFLAVGDANHETHVFDLMPDAGGEPVEVALLKGEGLPKWELAEWQRRYPDREDGIDDFISLLAFSRDTSRLLMTEFPLPSVTVWDWRQSQQIGPRAMVIEDAVVDLQVAPNHQKAVFGGNSANSQEVSLMTAGRTGPTRHHRTAVTRLRIDRGSRRLVTASRDGTVSFWDLEDIRPRPTSSFRPSESPVLAMAMDLESVVCATGDGAGRIHLWLVGSGQMFCDPLEAGAAVLDLAFHPRFPLLAAACADGRLRLWEIPTGQGRPPGSLSFLAESFAGLYLDDEGNSRIGAVFYFDGNRKEYVEAHQRQLKSREQNPAYRTSEYHRLSFDLYGLPEIPEPEWITGEATLSRDDRGSAVPPRPDRDR